MDTSTRVYSVQDLLAQQQDLPILAAHEIHVWHVDLGKASVHVEASCGLLSDAEKQKAGRQHLEADHARLLVRRGLLRAILGGYLGIQPDDVELVVGEMGKPALRARSGLEFSLAHSGDRTLVALTRGRQIGIDVEALRADDLEAISSLYFPATEHMRWRELPQAERIAAWYKLWTLKEAFAKLDGRGLTAEVLGLDIVSVLNGCADLGFETFEPAAGYAAALVFAGRPCRIVRFECVS